MSVRLRVRCIDDSGTERGEFRLQKGHTYDVTADGDHYFVGCHLYNKNRFQIVTEEMSRMKEVVARFVLKRKDIARKELIQELKLRRKKESGSDAGCLFMVVIFFLIFGGYVSCLGYAAVHTGFGR